VSNTTTFPQSLIVNIRRNCSETVAGLVKAGKAIAEFQAVFSRYPIDEIAPGLTIHPLFGVTEVEALLLARCAAERPAWVDPAAVDLSDPLANELLELAVQQATSALPNAKEVV
jgi:hypothetical protein